MPRNGGGRRRSKSFKRNTKHKSKEIRSGEENNEQ